MDKRSIIAFLLISVIMIFWMHREQTKARQREEWKRQQAARLIEQAEAEAKQEAEKPAPAAPQALAPAADVKDTATGGPEDCASALWSNRGAVLLSLRLNKYDETNAPADKGKGLTLLRAPDAGSPPLAAPPPPPPVPDPRPRLPPHPRVYDVAEQPASQPGGQKLVYTAKFAPGLLVTKTIETTPDTYITKVALALKNESPSPIPALQYEIVAASRVLPRSDSNDASERLITGCYAMRSGSRVRYTHEDASSVAAAKEKGKGATASGGEQLVAVGSASHYFAAVLMPKPQPGQDPWARDARLIGVQEADLTPDGKITGLM